MKIIILDDTRKRRRELFDALKKRRMEITVCYGCNDFINTVEKSKYDILLLDMESWDRGQAIYNRFGIAKRLEMVPVIFYNASTNFTALKERPRHPKDSILAKPTEVSAVVARLQENR